MGKERFDSERIYCRMLGHEIAFSYCRIVKEGLPCVKILDCWFQRLSVEEFIDQNYTEDEKRVVFTRPEHKITTLFDLINKAKKQLNK